MKHRELNYEFQRLRLLGYNKELSLGYFYNPKNRQILEFSILKNKETLKLFFALCNHIGLNSRHDKYLKVYKIFEALKGKPTTAWRAIRVSISHSPRKVTERPLVNYLLSNFGELEISFKNNRQNNLFYKVFTELVEATYYEILSLLSNTITVENNVAQKIIDVVDSIRLEYKKKKYSDVYYCLESKLREYIPIYPINPFIARRYA